MKTEDEILYDLGQLAYDPVEFVRVMFDWHLIGAGSGPMPWQSRILYAIRDQIGRGITSPTEAIKLATTSGHGVGKSALVSWIILWAMCTSPDTKGVVTANTETQLKTKTWAELAKWYSLFTAKEIFEFNATRLTIRTTDTDKQAKWRIDLVPWSERNTEAFAGLHNKGKRILLLMDEASAIPDQIWETAEGALTDANTEIIWCVFGNPTRNKGRFRDCFAGGRFSHRWQSQAVDSREVAITNKEQIANWVQDYGEDSDFVRVRVRGVFPRIDAESFIPLDLCLEAINRTVEPSFDPIILGVDVGRFGDDPSIIYPRRGRDGKSLPVKVMYGFDTMKTAATVAQEFLNRHAQFCFVDEGGVGGGVVDRLRQLNIPVIGVDFGSKSDSGNVNDRTKYANKRAEIWGSMREWLKTGCIPERVQGVEITLPEELTAPNYGMNAAEAIQLESKKDMRRRGIKSPNIADALACTFAFPIFEPHDWKPDAEHFPPVIAADYNPYTEQRIYAHA